MRSEKYGIPKAYRLTYLNGSHFALGTKKLKDKEQNERPAIKRFILWCEKFFLLRFNLFGRFVVKSLDVMVRL